MAKVLAPAAQRQMIEVDTPLLASLPEPALERVRRAVQTRHYAPGETIVSEGETLDELFIVVRGEALVVGRDWHGQRHVLARLGHGECFGELSMLSGEPASATVEASVETDVLVLLHADVSSIAEEYPELARNLSALLAERLRKSNERQLRAQRGRLVALFAPDDAPWAFWLAYRLAHSVARHTRQPVAFLDASGRADDLSHVGLRARSLEESLTDQRSWDGAAGSKDPREYLRIIRCDGANAPSTEKELYAGLERLQEGARNVLAFLPQSAPVASDTVRAADSVIVLTHESDLANVSSAVARCATPNGHEVGLVVLSDRVDAPTVGDLRRLQSAVDSSCRVHVIIPGGGRALGEDPTPDSPSVRCIDRQARKIAGLSVGLALGAGGAKGYAHIGVVRGLQRAGVPFDCVSGCSIGAPLAAGVAAGWSLDEIRSTLDSVSAKAVRPNMPFVSILTSRSIRSELRTVTEDARFEDLPTPLGIVAVDIETGEEVLLRRGLVWPAMVASMAYPGIYEPVRIGNRYLVDGGVLNPVPVSAAVTLGADVVISSILSGVPDYSVRARASDPNRRRLILESISRSLEIMQSKIVQESCTRADVAIQPIFEEPPGLLDFRRGRELEGAGEEAAERALPKLRSVLPWLA